MRSGRSRRRARNAVTARAAFGHAVRRVSTAPTAASYAVLINMGAPTWPPNPQRLERPGKAVALSASDHDRGPNRRSNAT